MEVEINKEQIKNKGELARGRVLITPPINADYFVARVHLHKDQYINAFPKFGTIGVGFAIEENWNTNLPLDTNAEELTDHIFENKKYEDITREKIIEAIQLLQKTIKELKNKGELQEYY